MRAQVWVGSMRVRPLGRFVCLAFVLAVALSTADRAAAQSGQVFLTSPRFDASFEAGDTIAVFGRVIEFNGTPIGGAQVTVRLRGPQGALVPGAEGAVVSSPNDGSFVIALTLPATLRTGTYTLEADALDTSIQDREVSIRIRERFSAPTLEVVIAVSVGTAAAIAVVLFSLRSTGRRKGHPPPKP